MLDSTFRALSTSSTTTVQSAATPPTLTAVLHDLNFDNAQAVRDAHAAITKLPALTQWYDQAFRDDEKAESLACVATLILHQAAETQGRSSAHIPGSRQQALARLSPQLSPTGEAALLQTLDEHPAANEFAQYFAASDRCSLAAQACRTEAETTRDRAGYRQAAHTFAQAAHAYAQAGQHTLASAAIDEAVALYMKARQFDAATTLLGGHAQTHKEAGREAEAVAAYTKLAHVYETVADIYTQRNRIQQAAEASLAAAQAHLEAGAHEHAARTFTTGAQAYVAAKQRDLAKATYVKAAEASLAAAKVHEQAGEHEHAARTLMTGASAYNEARQYADFKTTYMQAATASLAAAKVHQKAGEHEHAARNLMVGARAYAAVGKLALARDTYLQAAEASRAAAQAHQKAGEHEHAARTLMTGAQAYAAAQEHESARATYLQAAETSLAVAQAHQKAGEHEHAARALMTGARAYAEAGQHVLAQATYVKAADASLMATQVHEKAGQPEHATRTLTMGARAYTAAGQPKLAQVTYAKALDIYRALAQTHAQAGKPDLAAAAHRTGAELCIELANTYMHEGRLRLAGDAFVKAAKRYALAERPKDSSTTLKRAMAAYDDAHEHMVAARVAEQYTQFNREAGRNSLAIDGLLCAARAHARGQRTSLEAHAYAEAAELLWRARDVKNALSAYRKAASKYEEMWKMDEAEYALRNAAERCRNEAKTLRVDLQYEAAKELSDSADQLLAEANLLAMAEPSHVSARRRGWDLAGDTLATQKLDEQVIAKVHDALSPYALDLQLGGVFQAGHRTLTFGPLYFTGDKAFSPSDVEEWCLLARDWTLTDLQVVRLSVLAEKLPPNNFASDHHYTRVPAEQLVRGKDALALLSAFSKPVPAPTSASQSALSLT